MIAVLVFMHRILLLMFALLVIAIGFSCAKQNAAGSNTPTEAYKSLFAAVKSKDIESIKNHLTKKSNDFAMMAAQKNNTPLDKVYENGFTATTFSETLPPVRDERVTGDMGAVEVWNSKESKWEDLAFIREDGSWKLAVGDLFGGTYKSPGLGRDQIEKEAANAIAGPVTPMTLNPNANSNKVIISNTGPPAISPNSKPK